jgi:hypothetical protein
LLFGVCGGGLSAEESAGEDGQGVPLPFPIHRLWQEAREGTTRWNPGWPLDFPPDSFDPVPDGAREITVTITAPAPPPDTGGVSAGQPPKPAAQTGRSVENSADSEAVPPIEYVVQRDTEGHRTAFPFLLDGMFYQAGARYDRENTIEQLTLAASPEETIEIDFLQTESGLPVTARIKADDTYYFAAFSWAAGQCVELWTDEAGTPLAVLRETRTLHYDSMSNTTRIADSQTETTARYQGAGARYWTRKGTLVTLQRDERGLIVRLTAHPTAVPVEPQTRETDGTAMDEALDAPLNYSYEYQFDENGNWIERREIRWTEMDGYLVPSDGAVARRVIAYN